LAHFTVNNGDAAREQLSRGLHEQKKEQQDVHEKQHQHLGAQDFKMSENISQIQFNKNIEIEALKMREMLLDEGTKLNKRTAERGMFCYDAIVTCSLDCCWPILRSIMVMLRDSFSTIIFRTTIVRLRKSNQQREKPLNYMVEFY
jgi:hypothetical protein